MSVTEAAAHPVVRTALQQAVDAANRRVSLAESIRKFEVLTDDFTVDSGHLTPSLKLRRAQVLTDYDDAVRRLYGG
jgi:long-chain acyl-CoA synthetase